MQQRIKARRPPATVPSAKNPAGLLATTSADLLNLVDADFALLSVDGEAKAIGRLDPYPEAVAIMSYLQSCQFTEIRSSHNINADFPDISCASDIKHIAGFLLIPLNGGGANDFLVFFRKSQLRHIKWAGYVRKPQLQYRLVNIKRFCNSPEVHLWSCSKVLQ